MEYSYGNTTTTQWIHISGVIDTPGYYSVSATNSSSSTQPYIIHFDPSSVQSWPEVIPFFYTSDEPDELTPATDDQLDALYAAEKEEET